MKFINTVKDFWKDERGDGGVFSTIGLVIGSIVLAGVVVGIGVTLGKTKMSGVANEITDFNVEAPTTMNTSATDTTFNASSGDHTLKGITITN